MSDDARRPTTPAREHSRDDTLPTQPWSPDWGRISEEAVRRLHRPNYRHRFSVHHKYPPGTAFSGRQRAGTCYVLDGSCEFTFGDQRATIDAERFAKLPAGDFSFRVLGNSEVCLIKVWELPFDVVHHRRDGIEYLEDHGIFSTPRDWSMGKTIVAGQRISHGGRRPAFQQAVWLTPESAGWALINLTTQRLDHRSFPNLKAACDQLISEWLDPAWSRLSREEAKQLLARNRRAQVPETERPGALESYLVDDLKYSLNSYLREELLSLGYEVVVEGLVEPAGMCPCCEYFAIAPGQDGAWEICPVCFWENGGDGPNRQTLEQAKKNFDELGACDEWALQHVVSDPRRKYWRVRL